MLSKRALFGLFLFTVLIVNPVFGDLVDFEVDFNSDCGDGDYIILEMEQRINSHVQFPGEPDNYQYKLCYPDDNDLKVVSIPAGEDYTTLARECRGRNQVLSLFDRTNSHVESVEIGDYSKNLCYGFFESCRAEPNGYAVNEEMGEVALAWMSGETNAHLADIDEDGAGYGYKLVCEVPYCGSNQVGDIYPILFDFENEGSLTDNEGDFTVHTFVRGEPETVSLDPPTFQNFPVDNLQVYQGWFNNLGSATSGTMIFDGVFREDGTYLTDFELDLSNGENVWIYSDYAFFDQDPLGVDGASQRSNDEYYYLFNGVEVLLVNGYFEYNGVEYYTDRTWARLEQITLGDVEQIYRDESLTPSGDDSGADASIVSKPTFPSITGNSALKIDLIMDSLKSESRVTLYNLYKTDWSEFDYLEFYVIPLNTGALKIGIELIEPDGSLVSQEYDVSNHAPTRFENNKPSLIRLPINNIGDWSEVASLSFFIDDTTANYVGSGLNTFIVDTFVLRSDNPSSEFEEFYYCNGVDNGATVNTEWSDNLDPMTAGGAFGNQVSQFACESSDLYINNVIATTENFCCGEQLGEVYVDGAQGCYDGVVIDNGDIFDYITYSVNGVSFTSYCDDESCTYALPVVPTDDIINPGARFTIGDVPSKAVIQFDQSGSLQSEVIYDEIVINLTKPRFSYGELTTVSGIVGNRVYTTSDDSRFRVCGTQSTADFLGDTAQISTADVCSVVGDYYCTYDGYWSNDNSNVAGDIQSVDRDNNGDYVIVNQIPLPASNRTKESTDFSNSAAQGCCTENSCFHDGQCWADQSEFGALGVVLNGEYTDSADSGQRCIAGNWENAIQKPGLSRGDYGFCENQNQCLISSSFKPGDDVLSNCIDSGEHYQDYYCNEGNWSTRTILVASELRDLAGSDKYTLYCDTYDKVSNLGGSTQYSNQFLGSQSLIGTSLSSDCNIQFLGDEVNCVNNVCVLVDDNNDVYFGTSLNKKLRGTTAGEYITPESVFNGVDSTLNLECDDPNGKCEYNTADSDGTWIYDNETKIILYSPKNSNIITDILGTIFDGIGTAFNFINPFKSVPVELIPSQDIIQTLYQLKGDSNLEIAAFQIESNQNRDSDIATYVVRYGGATENTKNTICSGLQTYAEANVIGGVKPISVDCTAVDSLFVNSSSVQSDTIWSRITVALRQ